MRIRRGKLQNDEIYKIIVNYVELENDTIRIEFPPGKASESLDFKEQMEYQAFCPMRIEKSTLHVGPYSTNKILNIIRPYAKFSADKIKKIDKIINRTQESRCIFYAAGAIDRSPDRGVGPRKTLKNFLLNTRVNIVNPCDFEFNKDWEQMTSLNPIKKYRIARKIFTYDTSMVNICDGIIVYLDKYIGTGTPSECTLAKGTGKPVYGILAKNFKPEKLKPWMMGSVDKFFETFEGFRNFVVELE